MGETVVPEMDAERVKRELKEYIDENKHLFNLVINYGGIMYAQGYEDGLIDKLQTQG